MANHNKLGAAGEAAACEFLQSKGYVIRDVNWRSGKLELDIVAQTGSVLVVIEVKTRQDNKYGMPEDAVTPAKIRRIVNAADAYIRTHDLLLDVRFDVMSILQTPDGYEIEQIKDAFYPPLN